MNILFVADPLEAFKTYKDTTFSMMREAQRRGHRAARLRAAAPAWQSRRPWCSATVREITLTGDARRLVHASRTRRRARAAPTSTRC